MFNSFGHKRTLPVQRRRRRRRRAQGVSFLRGRVEKKKSSRARCLRIIVHDSYVNNTVQIYVYIYIYIHMMCACTYPTYV